jgi:hypothetical protein
MTESRKYYAGRGAEITVGLAYLLAAGLKAQNINLFIGQILAYQVFSSTGALTVVAFTTLSVETFLGVSMVLGSPWRKMVLGTGVAMLLFFSALIAYAWQFHGLKDCGCFGKVSMTPPQAIAKNVVLLALTSLTWYGLVRKDASAMPYSGARRFVPVILAVLLCVVALPQIGGDVPPDPSAPGSVPVAEGGGQPGGPFSSYRIVPEFGDPVDLSKGDYLVALLSMTCEHCMGTVPQLNAYTQEPGLPILVAICLEPEAGSLENFQNMTGPLFPMHSVGNDMLTWAKICSGVPPQLCYVRNGVAVKTWSDEMPTMDVLQAAIGGEGSEDSAQSVPAP